ncbi:Uncharacterised protein [Pseudomonas aeruginosa]|nr:Uncharacterised protein [Pseudomonas aeruginosa]
MPWCLWPLHKKRSTPATSSPPRGSPWHPGRRPHANCSAETACTSPGPRSAENSPSSHSPTSSTASRFTNMQAPEMASTGVGASGSGSLWSKKSENRAGNHLPRCDKPKARMNARLGVGKTRRPPGCSEPSGLHSSPPHHYRLKSRFPVRPFMRRKLPSASTLSGLRNNRVLALEARAPILQAAANPRFWPLRMMVTRASLIDADKWARLSSCESLSTTNTWQAPSAKNRLHAVGEQIASVVVDNDNVTSAHSYSA